ncbi:MAG: COX15/CtaA family protein [Gammaproteobacteria bacterium]|nr:COX15/CtaA family protein [Gammaproteobacteria bacterium]
MSGAWVRLTDAGLGCPDWPGCYGQLTPPQSAAEIERANAAFPDAPVETGKAWREMLHRYAIPFLGLIVLALAAIAIANRDDPFVPLLVPLLLIPLLGLQAALGMLTVTMLLQPIIVVAHLIGGMATLALLGYLAMRTWPREPQILSPATRFRTLAVAALAVVMVQIALGGWTSANYAALACPDFPTCQSQWWPDASFADGFVPWRGLGSTGPADSQARTAIHLAHRIGAIVTLLVVGGIGLLAALRGSHRGMRLAGAAMTVVVAIQAALGATIVLQRLPLALAVAHNGTAAVLLLATVALIVAAWRQA